MNKTASQGANWKAKLRHELLSYWMTVLYLALFFGAFTTYRRLILAQYQISYTHYGIALIEALVLAKVILIGDLLRLGSGYENRPLAISTLFRSFIFTICVLVFSVIEASLRGLFLGRGLTGGFMEFLNKGHHELLASCLVVFFTFIPFFALRELNRVLGEGKIWNLFFRRPAATPSNLPSAHPTTTPPPKPSDD